MPPQTSYTEDPELRFVKAQRQYDALKADAHAAVTHWLFTNGERFSLRLHYFERERVWRGEILANEPTSGGYYRYGLMVDERIAVEEHYENGQLVHESFWQYPANATQVIRYAKARPTLVSQVDYAEGLPILYRHYGYHSTLLRLREVYTHWDSRLTVIKSESTEYGRVNMEYHCIYTPQKELERIDVVTTLPGYMNTVYRAPIARNTGQSPPKLQALVDDIVATIKKEHIQKQVCGLILSYIYLEYFPPLLVPLFTEDRSAYLAQNPQHIELIWNTVAVSADGGTYIELSDSQGLWTALQADNDEVSIDPEQDEGRTFLADIARELNAVDWTGKLNISDDFVVFSLDIEGDSVQERLAASVPQAKLDLLRTRGLW